MKKVIAQFKNGFTLAEVLITLVIIGVVAAMTIPTLINNTKKQEYVAGLKKAYSVLSQAAYKIGQNKGYPVGDYSFFKDVDFIDEFSKVVSTTKKCNNFLDCFGKNTTGSDTYKSLKNQNMSVYDGKSVIVSDGSMYSFTSSNNVFTKYGISAEDESNLLGRILVDVNGHKPPNQMGYDLFAFYLVEYKGIIPAGNLSYTECNNTREGWTCASRVLKENAINY